MLRALSGKNDFLIPKCVVIVELCSETILFNEACRAFAQKYVNAPVPSKCTIQKSVKT